MSTLATTTTTTAAADGPIESPPADPGERVILRGTRRGLEIWISTAGEVAEIASLLRAKLGEGGSFFSGGDVLLRFDGKPPSGWLAPLEEVTSSFQLRIVAIQSPEDVVRPVASPAVTAPPLAASAELPSLSAVAAESVLTAEPSTEDSGLAPKMVTGPIRSGCILESAGHLIVIGDVNPGAEVRAAGSIVVLGRLRGIAHAGCEGATGFILALGLEPQQLRIGALVARAGEESPGERAEIAYAKAKQIIVDTYTGRLPNGIATAKF